MIAVLVRVNLACSRNVGTEVGAWLLELDK